MQEIMLIQPDALTAWAALGERAARGEPIPAAIRSATQSHGNTRVLEMRGVLLPGDVPAYAKGRATSMPELAEQFRAAAADPSVSDIALISDSPGGYVRGTQDLSDTIYGLRGSKPMVTVVTGQCCSAALWAGSATGRIVIANDTAQVGSIGAIVAHVDLSGTTAARVTEVSSGKFKGAASPFRPLDEVGRATLQASVDHVHGVFVSQLARNLGTTAKALSPIADGRVFHGKQAIEAGLAQGLEPVHSVLAKLAAAAPRAVAKAPPADVAARARIWAAAEEQRTGRRVGAAEAVAFIQSLV
jgi:signal peptide peptidase SppA